VDLHIIEIVEKLQGNYKCFLGKNIHLWLLLDYFVRIIRFIGSLLLSKPNLLMVAGKLPTEFSQPIRSRLPIAENVNSKRVESALILVTTRSLNLLSTGKLLGSTGLICHKIEIVFTFNYSGVFLLLQQSTDKAA